MTDGVSSVDIAAIRRRHHVYQARDARTGAPVQVCAGCGRDWPCDVPALLAALAAAEQRAAASEADNQRLRRTLRQERARNTVLLQQMENTAAMLRQEHRLLNAEIERVIAALVAQIANLASAPALGETAPSEEANH